MNSLTDAVALSRCGFTVHSPTKVMATKSWNSPRVRYLDHQATMVMRLVANLISSRVGSHLVHTHSYPGELALSFKPETRAAALAEFDHDLVAWLAAKERC